MDETVCVYACSIQNNSCHFLAKKKRLLCVANQMSDKCPIQHLTLKGSIGGEAASQSCMSSLHQSISSFDPLKESF